MTDEEIVKKNLAKRKAKYAGLDARAERADEDLAVRCAEADVSSHTFRGDGMTIIRGSADATAFAARVQAADAARLAETRRAALHTLDVMVTNMRAAINCDRVTEIGGVTLMVQLVAKGPEELVRPWSLIDTFEVGHRYTPPIWLDAFRSGDGNGEEKI